MSGFKCQKCLSKAESVLTMSFISFWAFLVFCFFVQNALASGQVIRVINVTTSASHLTPSGEESSGVSAGALQEMDEQKFTLSVNPMVEGIKVRPGACIWSYRWLLVLFCYACWYQSE